MSLESVSVSVLYKHITARTVFALFKHIVALVSLTEGSVEGALRGRGALRGQSGGRGLGYHLLCSFLARPSIINLLSSVIVTIVTNDIIRHFVCGFLASDKYPK